MVLEGPAIVQGEGWILSGELSYEDLKKRYLLIWYSWCIRLGQGHCIAGSAVWLAVVGFRSATTFPECLAHATKIMAEVDDYLSIRSNQYMAICGDAPYPVVAKTLQREEVWGR